MQRTWRDCCRPLIARVIQEHRDNPQELRKALKEAYPYGMRKYHPYKIWLDEIQRQLGTKPPLGWSRPFARRAAMPPDPRQEGLFS